MEPQNLFQISPIGIGIIKDRTIISINERACDEIGYSHDELIGKDARLLYFTDEEYERVGKEIYPMLVDKGFGDIETKFRHKNGDPIYVWIRIAWLDRNNHELGQVFSVLNFTEQVQAKLALRENNERFLQAGKFAHFGVWEVDLSSGRVIADETYRHLMGYSSHDKFETPEDWLQCIVSEQDRRVARILLNKLIRNELYTLKLEHKARKKDGSIIQTELLAELINKDGQQHLLGFSRDITEFHKMREALKTQQEQYRFLIESTKAILFSADPKTFKFDFISKEAESLLGYPIEQCKNEPDFFINHIHPADRDWVIDYCRDAINQKKSHVFDYRFITADGSVIWLHDMTSLVVENDEVTQLIGAFIDITPQKQTEAQLRTLSNVVEQSPDAILLADKDFNITYLNPAFTRLYHYTLADIEGQKPGFLCGVENQEEYLEQLLERVQSGENIFDVSVSKRKDNSTFICQFWISPLQDDMGKTIGYMGSQRDITTQVKQEQEIKEAEARYRMLFEHTPQGVILFNANGSVITANPAAERITGYDSNMIRDLHTFDKERPCIREDGTEIPWTEHPAMLALLHNTPVRQQVIGMFNPEKNAYIWINVDAVPLINKATGKPDRAFTTFSDITKSRKLQQALIQRQRMEAVGQLTGGIAHDFNNILGSILGFAELARLNFAEGNEKLDSYLQQIETAGGRARDLIRELMIFSRGDSKKAATAQPLIPQIKSIITLIKPMLSAGITIETEFPQQSPLVNIDPFHLQQLLMNLCVNAKEAMDGSGQLTIKLASGQIKSQSCDLCNQRIDGEWVQITVSDTGKGILGEVMNDLFQPFVSTKDVGEGSGMGLPVVKGIIETYNGHVFVTTSNEGSSFQLLLPHSESTSTPENPAQT